MFYITLKNDNSRDMDLYLSVKDMSPLCSGDNFCRKNAGIEDLSKLPMQGVLRSCL